MDLEPLVDEVCLSLTGLAGASSWGLVSSKIPPLVERKIRSGSNACHTNLSQGSCLVLRGILTFAHQIPFPSTARSQTWAKARIPPAAQASRCDGAPSNSDLAPTRELVYKHIDSQAIALVRRACLGEEAMYARMEAASRASGRVLAEAARASCWRRDSNNGMRRVGQEGERMARGM